MASMLQHPIFRGMMFLFFALFIITLYLSDEEIRMSLIQRTHEWRTAKIIPVEVKEELKQKEEEEKKPVVPVIPHYDHPIVKEEAIIPVLMMSCDRVTIERALNVIFKYRPSSRFPVIVSQDCGHQPTSDIIDSFGDRLMHLVFPYGEEEQRKAQEEKYYNPKYRRISQHYHWALHQVFDVLMYDQVIMVEDDMEVSPDFFGYFDAMLPVLKHDPSLYCVSSWNDDGKKEVTADPTAFYRSDFMPGLGWMMLKSLWEEIKVKWPKQEWDEWLRRKEQRQGRSCIIPEISRNFNFGKDGASGGYWYDEHIGRTVSNHEPLDYSLVDVFALEKSRYDAKFLQQVYDEAELLPLAPAHVTFDDMDIILQERIILAPHHNFIPRLRLEYATKEEFQVLARLFDLMDYVSVDAPRASYYGVVTLKRHVLIVGGGDGRVAVIYLAPKKGYWHGDINTMEPPLPPPPVKEEEVEQEGVEGERLRKEDLEALESAMVIQ